MQNIVVSIDTKSITDWESFHNLFAELFEFPEFFGRNMDAWNDCMSSLDQPSHGMTQIHASPGNVVVLHLKNAKDFSERCPEQYAALVECSAFVNYRRIEHGLEPLLTLAFYM
jgi:RNAse (barnase) inhibitor barstar